MDDDPDITLENAEFARKVSGEDDGHPEGFTGITRTTSNDDPLLTGSHVVGGTAFFSSRPKFEQSLDWPFIDDAGQVGLANIVAMARAARNIVLVGDPRQLPQVIQGAHPEPANPSCLDWMPGDHATPPPDRGILLLVSRRMHPKVSATRWRRRCCMTATPCAASPESSSATTGSRAKRRSSTSAPYRRSTR